MLGAVDDLDDAALVQNAVLSIARSFGAHESPVADARHLALAGAARDMEANLGRLAVGFLVPFGRDGDQLAVSVAGGDVGEHNFGQCARMVQLLASFLDRTLIGEVAKHLLEGCAIRVLETEGAGDLSGADVAGFLADEGKHVLFGGERGVSAGLGIQIYVQEYFMCSTDGAKRNPSQRSGARYRA